MADPKEPRSIEDIYAELAAHPDFVCGNYYTEQNFLDAGWDSWQVEEIDEDDMADVISDAVLELP